MGNNQSLPSDISREKLSELTTDTRYIMDKILEFMITELSIRDFVSISDKSQCDKYVLFKANVLYKYFDQLQIMPSMDKSGVIAFRKFDDIRKSQGDSKERQSLCLIIAYYYTRIFQIYGALALTLIDDMETATKSGIFSGRTAPGFEGVPNIFRGQRGGADIPPEIVDRLGNFQFLSTYLNYMGSYTTFITKYPNSTIQFENNYNTSSFKISYGKTGNKIATINIRSTTRINPTIKLTDLRYTMSKQGRPAQYSRYMISYDEKKFQDKMIEWAGKTITCKMDPKTLLYTIDGKSLSDFFNRLFDNIVPFIIDLSKEGDVEKTGLTKSKHDELDIKKVYESIKVDNKVIRPRAHCIARALQLLQVSPLGKSFVCDRTFDYKKSGLPIPNQPISTSNGISSLANLFYDTIQNGSIKIGINPTTNDKSTFEKYINFMKNMATLFDNETYKTIDNKNPKYIALSSITNKRDKTLCDKIGKEAIDLDKKTADSVNNNVKALFKIQYAHAIKCGDIFKQMFNIQRDEGSNRVRIKLSNNIYRIGFPEIERINNLTRNVLVDYYSNCENEYLLGVQKIIDSQKPAVDKPVVAVDAKPVAPVK
jgi:hypothetical protein